MAKIGLQPLGYSLEAANAQAIPAHHQPVTVMLALVNPERAGRRSGYLRRQARFDEAGRVRHDQLRHLYRKDLEPSAIVQFNTPVILSKLMTTA
jgi:hypothetical protein